MEGCQPWNTSREEKYLQTPFEKKGTCLSKTILYRHAYYLMANAPMPPTPERVLQFWPSICTSRCTFSCVSPSRLAKSRLGTQNASQKAPSGTGKQHGLASSRTPFFDLRWGDLQCQTLRPEPIKKRILQLWGSFRTSNWLRNASFAPSVAFGCHDWQNHDF